MSSACGTNGVWQVSGNTLASGIYYATCAVKLNGNPIGGDDHGRRRGRHQVSGSGAFFDPYMDGLLFLSNSNSTSAIRVDAADSTFFGYSFAERGRIVLTGSGDKVYCGILADRIDISSQNLRVHGSACYAAQPDRGAADVVPALASNSTVDKADALPSTSLDPHGDDHEQRRHDRRARHHRGREPRDLDGERHRPRRWRSSTCRRPTTPGTRCRGP